MPRPSTAPPPKRIPTAVELATAGTIFDSRGRLWVNNNIKVYVVITLAESGNASFLQEFFGGNVNPAGRYYRWLIGGSQMCDFLNAIAPYARTDSAKRLARKALLHEAIMNEEDASRLDEIRAAFPLGVHVPTAPTSPSSEQSSPETHKFEDIFHLLSGDFDQMETLRFFFETPIPDGGLSSLACSAGDDSILDSWLREASLPAPAGLADVCSVSKTGSFLILTRRTS
jgi:hypothetical protein